MVTHTKPIYRRIVLKMSGEALQGAEGFGIDTTILNRMVTEVKELVKIGIQIGIVMGGGNLFRGAELVKSGMNRIVGDHIGMLATIMNGLAMRSALNHAYVHSHLMSAIPLNGVCDHYNWMKAINLLSNNWVVIFAAGTGNPLFTTDSAACLRGIEIKADVVLKATKVDGVFSTDPIQHPDATLYEQLSYQDVLERELKVMDLTAFTLAREHNLPIRIFNINKLGALKRIIMGYKEGTLITK
ncbi:uridylate kinase [Candidatus Blochmanniella pennsylvanica str. BPEN]|uniref:Uridylate kinase n=2 Tax=Candidatus Blochmanniella TaxID=203804 RepID=PYRH_BLOPB|nr:MULTISPECIES: UMP kinase [Blochmannia]Q493D0.1 RecName: Full=Uridylate kinase; Short=UK; AltName: Full=Uridine monophosphate kinase; Short=UMP kinase; Short=UMPK [Candidatus Blochmannia pennsylvanicus str. BPEN]AAZ40912.1 uridylate kinase [Candidatus Blochmannia pennsylvanicus str. BPEN]AGC03554.1 Uridylate kinase [Candidatus Blochmannia chromaiodes str. 640]UOY04139.1 UMP kinase [Candidatus Blochmannia pennsylvanicus]